jgi:hypothetical protein
MDHLTIFIGVTAAAVVIQASILVAMYFAMRKTSSKVEAIAAEVSSKVLPTAEMVQSMLTQLRPKIEVTVTNVSETTTLVRAQLQRMDAAVNDIIDRTRLQVIRADEMIGRTLDRVEDATEKMHDTVVSPVRQISGLFHGISAGVGTFLGKRKSHNGVGVPQDEMFI